MGMTNHHASKTHNPNRINNFHVFFHLFVTLYYIHTLGEYVYKNNNNNHRSQINLVNNAGNVDLRECLIRLLLFMGRAERAPIINIYVIYLLIVGILNNTHVLWGIVAGILPENFAVSSSSASPGEGGKGY